MFCPECGAEFRDGFERCVDCDLPLTPVDPNEPQEVPPLELVTVLASGNAALLALAQSLLQDQGIRHCLKGDLVQDLFGGGRLGAGFNLIVGPAQIQVDAPDAEAAASLLRDLHEAHDDSIYAEESEPGGAAEPGDVDEEPFR